MLKLITREGRSYRYTLGIYQFSFNVNILLLRQMFLKKFIRIICFSYAMPNLNPWQKIYSKTKYKRSKRERVMTIGFELVFLVLKREKIYWNITFHLFLKCSENLGVSVLVFHVFFFLLLWSLYFRVFCRPREGYLYSSIYMVNPYRCQFMVMQLLMEL